MAPRGSQHKYWCCVPFKVNLDPWLHEGANDDVKSTIDIPSWKRMCYCILKNDYNCRFMGFGPTKEQQARIKEIKGKYGAVLRGKKYVPESSV